MKWETVRYEKTQILTHLHKIIHARRMPQILKAPEAPLGLALLFNGGP